MLFRLFTVAKTHAYERCQTLIFIFPDARASSADAGTKKERVIQKEPTAGCRHVLQFSGAVVIR